MYHTQKHLLVLANKSSGEVRATDLQQVVGTKRVTMVRSFSNQELAHSWLVWNGYYRVTAIGEDDISGEYCR